MENNLEKIFLSAIEANKDRIFRICRSYSSDLEDVRDLFQEVLINIWKSLPTFKSQSSINTWIYRISINVCLRAKQFSDKKEKYFVRFESVSFKEVEDPNSFNGNEKHLAKLSECVKKLEGIDKSIILLYLEDLPYKEIADVLGLSENNVAVKIRRIKNKLLKCLNSNGHER